MFVSWGEGFLPSIAPALSDLGLHADTFQQELAKVWSQEVRNYINAMVGFQELAERTHTPEKSLMRIFGPKGNPSSQNMFGIIAELATTEGVDFSLTAKPRHSI